MKMTQSLKTVEQKIGYDLTNSNLSNMRREKELFSPKNTTIQPYWTEHV
jgi:hypothetical protein